MMRKARAQIQAPSHEQIVGSIADRTRRETLRILQNRADPVATDELATLVAAAITGADLVDITRAGRDQQYVQLVHVHLPTLDDAGLIDWNTEDGFVTTSNHAAFGQRQFQRLLAVDAADWDSVLEALRSPRRRITLAVLEDADSLGRHELARRVAAYENESAPSDVAEQALEAVSVVLHHNHIPALQQAGLIVYDDETARYAGHPELEPEWLTSTLAACEEESADSSETIWTIDGRDSIIERGQNLFRQATDELFLMVTTDGLLEAECLEQLQAALDRGVDVYAGSQTQAVRDLIREEVPDATIWEPQRGWLNLPPNYETVGRLVFADRDAVMIGTIGDGPDGEIRETAITGEGQDNSLVVLFRDLLGTRLDHLDTQSEDFLSEIPL